MTPVIKEYQKEYLKERLVSDRGSSEVVSFERWTEPRDFKAVIYNGCFVVTWRGAFYDEDSLPKIRWSTNEKSIFGKKSENMWKMSSDIIVKEVLDETYKFSFEWRADISMLTPVGHDKRTPYNSKWNFQVNSNLCGEVEWNDIGYTLKPVWHTNKRGNYFLSHKSSIGAKKKIRRLTLTKTDLENHVFSRRKYQQYLGSDSSDDDDKTRTKKCVMC
jgi:hypothetical protein